MGVIPLEIETVKPKPIINALAILSPFFILAILKTSFNIGKTTTNKTDGEVNKPTIKTEKRNKKENQIPFFLASGVLINHKVIRLIIVVLDKA